ncbi:MAG: bifunctional proline dehydrogenase/L-glutamate gamma-semialdehyde dehydrogenase [Candidatus Omnitrophica bacterium]|nr:bifunctional proline dehydrogenase/L-glutamate gamma-semialdehyde dehydrogenase [Candidatus Omnitrophota bacterium]
MRDSPNATPPLDADRVEEHTQAIGRELFTSAKRQHAHLSVLNRWTAQVLSWCLSGRELKSRVLRFVDVLPSLKDPRDVARHVRDYFPPDFRLPVALRLGTRLADQGLLTQRALTGVVHQLVAQVAKQFIAAADPGGVSDAVHMLALRGAASSLDVLGEQILSEQEADRYVTQCLTVLEEAAKAYAQLPPSVLPVVCGPRLSVSIKPSALTPRFDPISPEDSVERACRRLLPVLKTANDLGGIVYLDMEQYELRDLTLHLVKHLLVHPQAGSHATLGMVIQTYLNDAEMIVEDLLEWLQRHERSLTIRLVKGAYWDYEVALARQCHWPIPVYQQKAQSDATFERLTRRLLRAHPLVTTAIASHNVRSIAHAMAVAEGLRVPKSQMEFQLLYGMGEAIEAAVMSMAYPVRIYTPIGDPIPGMAYLVRRLLENSANDSFLRHDFFQERTAEELLALPEDVPTRSEPAHQQAIGDAGAMAGEPWLNFSNASTRQQMAATLAAVKAKFGATYPLQTAAGSSPAPQQRISRNPARPDDVLGQVHLATRDDVDQAVRAAESAALAWGRQPVAARADILRRAAGQLRAHRMELAAWEVFEVGKTWREADIDVVEAIEYLEYYSQQMLLLADGKRLPQLPGEQNTYRYVPRGVAAVIAPWNFPSAILMGMTSAALMAGNPVIVKPAATASIVASHLIRLLREAGVPEAVVQLLPGVGEDMGAALVAHPQIRAVLFTGSRAVGLSIIETCGKRAPGQRFVKQAIVEMGGKNAIIVDADADLDAAIAGTLRSAFGYGGQKCSAASRVIVHEDIYDRFLARLIAATDRLVLNDPADPATDLGPLIDESAQKRLQAALARAERIAQVAYRYPASRVPASGFFFGPAIVTDVPPQDPLAQEELFGPLVCVFRVRSLEDALTMANDTDYALTGGIYSRSPANIARAIEAFDVGNLYINRPITGAMVGRQPFGGHRLSGLGTKAGGPDYLLHLLLPKTVCANTARHGMPLE